MRTIEHRHPTDHSQSIYITELGQLAFGAYQQVRDGDGTLRTKVLAHRSHDVDADRQFALMMVGISAAETSDPHNPIADAAAEWGLAQAVRALEESWGLWPQHPMMAAQDAACRHGVIYDAVCSDCAQDDA